MSSQIGYAGKCMALTPPDTISRTPAAATPFDRFAFRGVLLLSFTISFTRHVMHVKTSRQQTTRCYSLLVPVVCRVSLHQGVKRRPRSGKDTNTVAMSTWQFELFYSSCRLTGFVGWAKWVPACAREPSCDMCVATKREPI